MSLPVESAEACFPRREVLSDGAVVEPINCQVLMALAIIDHPLLAQSDKPVDLTLPDLLTLVGLTIGSAQEWAPIIERRDAKALRILAIVKAREITPTRLAELAAAIQRQVSRGLAGLVPLRSPGEAGASPLPDPTAGPSPRRPTTGAGRSSSSRPSCANTASRGRAR